MGAKPRYVTGLQRTKLTAPERPATASAAATAAKRTGAENAGILRERNEIEYRGEDSATKAFRS